MTAIEVSAGLHLKSIVNYVGRNTLLLTEGYVNHPAFSGFNRIVIPEEEAYAGNTLWINDTLITPQGYPCTGRNQQAGNACRAARHQRI